MSAPIRQFAQIKSLVDERMQARLDAIGLERSLTLNTRYMLSADVAARMPPAGKRGAIEDLDGSTDRSVFRALEVPFTPFQ